MCAYKDSGRGIGSSLLARAASRKAASPKPAWNCGAVG
jgi:hypothetical protein